MILEEIRNRVEEKTGFDLRANSRKQKLVTARYIYMNLAYKFTKETYSKIAGFVGRDHSTMIYAIESLSGRLFYEEDMKLVHEELLKEFGEKYSSKTRSQELLQIDYSDRRRKKLLRQINAMTEKELTRVEQSINGIVNKVL